MLINNLDDLPFEEIWAHDFEFIASPGERPDVVCLVAHELRSGRTLKLWRDELGEQPPYRTDDKVLFVNFSGQAEMCCHLALGWPVPRNIIDLRAIFRNLTNGKATPEGKGLIGMQRYYGFDAISSKRKDAMRDRIMRGWPFTPAEQEQILQYCAGDVKPALQQLLVRVLPDIDLGVALYWGEFVAVSAKMQHRGVPIDMENFSQLTDKNVWRLIRDEMVPVVDAQYGVFTRNVVGDWVFSWDRWTAYLKREGIYELWPRLETGKLDMRRKTFENMSRGFPQLEALRQLRHTRDKMRKVKLAVGKDGRNRTVLWSFKSKTGRTQPAAAEWIFSPAVWLRSLIKPASGMAVAYVDYSSMEFLLAASLSDGHCGPVNNMLDMYRSGDPYLSFAKSVNAVPQSATRKTPGVEEIRDRYKVMLLSTQYGLWVTSLAARLKISEIEAHEMLCQHHEQFSQYWAWSDDYIQHAMQTGYIQTAMGWGHHIGIVGVVNEKSLRNWPIQSAGADILRISCIMAERHGIRLLGPIHDAVLIEAPIERIEADVALMQEIMRRASRVVLNRTAEGTHELRTDFKIFEYPKHYTDPRGDEIWEHVLQIITAHRTAQGQKRA